MVSATSLSTTLLWRMLPRQQHNEREPEPAPLGSNLTQPHRVRNIFYPASAGPDPHRVLYQTDNLTIWDAYLRAGRVFCDMDLDVRSGIPDDMGLANGMLAWVCPGADDSLTLGLGPASILEDGSSPGLGAGTFTSEGSSSGGDTATTSHGTAGRAQGHTVKGVMEGFMRGVEGFLVVGVMLVGVLAVIALLAVGAIWVLDKIARWRGDEYEEESRFGSVGGSTIGERGRDEGARKGDGRAGSEYGDLIPLVEKPKEAKLATEHYYL